MSECLAEFSPVRPVPEGRHGVLSGPPGVCARVVEGLALATLAARKTGDARLRAAAQAAFGLDLPHGPRRAQAGAMFALGTAPGRWLVGACDNTTGEDLLERLGAALGGHGALTDQSDANLVLDVCGPHVGTALEKLVPLDLHPSVFAPGCVAATSIALIPLLFWQKDPSPCYRFAVGRSFAPAFLRALAVAAAPLGFELTGTGRG